MTPRPDCGSERGYRAHLWFGEKTCQPCCDAHALAMANWKATGAFKSGPRRDEPLRYRAALRGHEPADALTSHDRRSLVTELYGWGWTDGQIANHTRMTRYTTARIRDSLGLPANRERRMAA